MSKKKTKEAELLLDDILINTGKYTKQVDSEGNIIYVLKK